MVGNLKCEICGSTNEKLKEIVEKKKIPFYCKVCGRISFKYQAIRDIVFVWPDPPKEQVGSIIIPDVAQKLDEYGTVLSVGEGTFDAKRKVFIPTQVKVGDYVVYDKDIPWQMDVEGADGKKHLVKYMGQQDIKGIVYE